MGNFFCIFLLFFTVGDLLPQVEMGTEQYAYQHQAPQAQSSQPQVYKENYPPAVDHDAGYPPGEIQAEYPPPEEEYLYTEEEYAPEPYYPPTQTNYPQAVNPVQSDPYNNPTDYPPGVNNPPNPSASYSPPQQSYASPEPYSSYDETYSPQEYTPPVEEYPQPQSEYNGGINYTPYTGQFEYPPSEMEYPVNTEENGYYQEEYAPQETYYDPEPISGQGYPAEEEYPNAESQYSSAQAGYSPSPEYSQGGEYYDPADIYTSAEGYQPSDPSEDYYPPNGAPNISPSAQYVNQEQYHTSESNYPSPNNPNSTQYAPSEAQYSPDHPVPYPGYVSQIPNTDYSATQVEYASAGPEYAQEEYPYTEGEYYSSQEEYIPPTGEYSPPTTDYYPLAEPEYTPKVDYPPPKAQSPSPSPYAPPKVEYSVTDTEKDYYSPSEEYPAHQPGYPSTKGDYPSTEAGSHPPGKEHSPPLATNSPKSDPHITQPTGSKSKYPPTEAENSTPPVKNQNAPQRVPSPPKYSPPSNPPFQRGHPPPKASPGSSPSSVYPPPSTAKHPPTRKLLTKKPNPTTAAPQVSTEKLNEIKKLSPFAEDDDTEEGYSYRSEVCYTNACADSALSILRSINSSIEPCDDFYAFSCGQWISQHPASSNEPSISVTDILRKQAEELTQKILNSPQNPTDSKPLYQAKGLYALCTDTAGREKAGIGLIVGKLRSYGGWPTITTDWDPTGFNLVKAIADSNRFLQNIEGGQRTFSDAAILVIYVKEDLKDATKRIVYLDQPGFLLSRSILLQQTKFQPRITAFESLYFNLATSLISFQSSTISPDAVRQDAVKVLAFETQLAKISATAQDRLDLQRIYNPKRLAEYQEETNASNFTIKQSHCKLIWLTLLQELASGSRVTISPEENVIVLQPSYITSFIRLCDITDVRTLSNYINFRLVVGFARQTTTEMDDFVFEFDKVNQGLAVKETLEKECSVLTLNVFGLAVGAKYIEQIVYEKQVKPLVDEIVELIRTDFVERFGKIDWMDESTRKEAILKTKNLIANIAYPDFLFNDTKIEHKFRGIEIYKKEYFQSWMAVLEWLIIHNFKGLRHTPDRESESWFTYSGNVQVVFLDQLNSLVIPAVHPPFYLLEAPKYINHGGIGVLIATSMIRAFDLRGSDYDSDGTARHWWTNSTDSKYDKKSQCFVNQSGGFDTPVGNVNGALTAANNIADSGGIRMAYETYRKWLKKDYGNKEEKRLPGLFKYTPEQMFFLQYATTMCQSITSDGLRKQLLTSIRPPNKYRVLGALQNFDTFAQIWDCPAGSTMNSPPEKECIIF